MDDSIHIISRLMGAPLHYSCLVSLDGKQGRLPLMYNILCSFPLISTVGIPVAIAKQVFKYKYMERWRRVLKRILYC